MSEKDMNVSEKAEVKKTKQKKPQVTYQSDQEPKILSVDGKLKTESPSVKKRKALAELRESLEKEKILTGFITGVEHHGTQYGALAIVYLEDFKIMIPSTDCIVTKAPEGKTQKEHEEYSLGKMIGSEIDFIIRGIKEKDEIAIASRNAAMLKKRKKFFLETDENGRYAVSENALVEARIISTSRGSIVVEVFGTETQILSRELSYQRIQDATKEYRVGEYIAVKILSILKDKEASTVQLEVSVKQTRPNPAIKNMKRYLVGEKYTGTVSMVDKFGIIVKLAGQVDCLCAEPKRGNRPLPGAAVTIQITTYNEEQNRLFGIITYS